MCKTLARYTSENAKRAKRKLHTMAAVIGGNSGNVCDVFTDVIKRTNLTVADDVS